MDGPVPETAAEGVDPDLDPLALRHSSFSGQLPVVAVVAVGGAVGACARYGLGLAWPVAPDAFPWSTLVINTSGCAVIGVFMVLITEAWTAHRLVRPFFGTGVLGGFTTFSTYAVDVQRLVDGGHTATGLGYLVGTPVSAMLSVWAAAAATRWAIGRRTR
ncbi:FluC/FEX family fluoride channel [Streptacidiphilus melanogenes]|uniref:fluoride efflux transporter FluC n=1 Tax=Streptacidiphilus melanogenes TaxID=411235 RepID=UPI0005AB0577